MTPADLAEYARAAEQGQSTLAAQTMLHKSSDADAGTLEALIRLSELSDVDVTRFHEDHEHVYCIRVPGLGEFWLAPLECWSQLPLGAAVVSPRGIKALGAALANELA